MAGLIFLICIALIIFLFKKAIDQQGQKNTTSILGLSGTQNGNTDKSCAQRLLNQLRESLEMVDKTLEPETFFGRLHFSFDCLLELMTYDASVFKDATPAEEYARLLDGIEDRVNALISRTYASESVKAETLKTEKGRQDRLIRYFAKMEVAFSKAHEFWTGNNKSAHYTGILYTENNVKRLEEMKKSITQNQKDKICSV